MSVPGKEQINAISHWPHQWPAQECHPPPTPGKPPCQHGDIQAVDQGPIFQFPVQDAVGLDGVDMRKALRKICSTDVLQIKLAPLVQPLKMPHLIDAERAKAIVINAKCAGLWCIHERVIPLLVQGLGVSTLAQTLQIFVCCTTLPFAVPMGFTRQIPIVPELSFMQLRPAGNTLLALLLCSLLLPVGMIAIFYFLLIRPQQQQMKKHRAKVAAVKKGDQVVTGGGLVGKVVRVDDAYVDVELGQGIKVKAVKATLSDVIDPMTAKPAND